MMKKIIWGLIAGCLTVSVPSYAEVFIAPFGGYSFGGNGLDVLVKSDTTTDLDMSEGGSSGLIVGMTTNDPGNMYFLFSRHNTDLRQGGLSSDILTELEVNYFHLGGTLYFPNGNINPYITASAGLTQLRPDKQYSSETNFSMGLGGGVAYELTDNVSIFADIRGYATFVNSTGGLFCNQASCIWQIEGDLMWQGQTNIGVAVSF
ncbi:MULTISPECIES: outer membrane beta-barrel protein [Pseudomonadati]|uniref:Porin family protein n=1 Tax=Shewanella aestuarii TaxID=1028752 RepID=A0ABT0L0H3_9GAMM|nr:outer membrane beta-barrel protein [Shewanella aestuarii]MCL1117197.1 porin family protein [Shewanella aestuarii]GGN74079.1 outer membrane protein [Shewanella aestuarii]